ncbi:CapA family protein [Tepidimonas sp.]|uniref:CapA family protein n=1 Tax=Tepidimonas sp. TaxID=2002775 RepID=UPI00391D44C6
MTARSRRWRGWLIAGGLALASVLAVAQEVTLAFMGDVMLADGPGRLIQRGGDPFRAVSPWLARADVRVANLECVVARGGSPEPDKPYTFRAHPRVLSVVRREGQRLQLTVDDDGPGLTPEQCQQVLARGVRADERVPGSGLGLDIVREVASLYGGALTLARAPLGGLRAQLELPAVSKA